MALITVQRPPSVVNSPLCSLSDIDTDDENCETECFFAGKGTCLILPLKEKPLNTMERRHSTDSNKSTNSNQSNSSDIQQHLQQMFVLLRREDTLKMAVKLESQRPNRKRYLAVVSHSLLQNNVLKKSRLKTDSEKETTTIEIDKNIDIKLIESDISKQNKDDVFKEINTHKKKPSMDLKDTEESCLLGIDCNEKTTIGLVLPILADTSIHLDGDGGFKVSVFGKTHIFKPVSVQAMWSALQSLHKVSQKARDNNLYPGGPSHDWVSYYHSRIDSERSCLNEWNTMDSLESRRPPSPDAIRNKPTEKEEAEKVIKMKLREIMMSVDLDEVTSKYIRGRLEELLNMDLGEYKSFIDEEMLTILGQMDAPTKIFEHVYLGSEWNASNLEELQKNGVRHILNVTREIDNFFPGIFDYYNVRVYDDEKTNLLKYWDNTFRYISGAKSSDSKVLVHCKMGVSRSASVVIAYAMKAYNWDFNQAINHVKERRNCIKPNKNFLAQLETYRGMLDAMKNKEKLQRSKSETNLKAVKDARLLPGSEPTPLIQALNRSKQTLASGKESHRKLVRRSSSSSPKITQNNIVIKQQSQSLENLTPPDRQIKSVNEDQQRNIRHTDIHGQNYSVTQNQVLHLQKYANAAAKNDSGFIKKPIVKKIINDLENSGGSTTDNKKSKSDRKSLNLYLTTSTEQPSLPVWISSTRLIQQSTEPCTSRIISKLDQIVSTNKDQLDKNNEIKTSDQQKRFYVQSWQANNLIESNTSHQISSNRNIDSNEIFYKFDKQIISARNSSLWSSTSTRILPLRNNSLGSYDTNNRKTYRLSNQVLTKGQFIKPDIISKDKKNTYSLERSKPETHAFSNVGKIESSITHIDKFMRCNSEEIILGVYSKNNQRLSASTPDAFSQSTLPKNYEKFPLVAIYNKLENERQDANSSSKFPNNVQNLKRNFEAKVQAKDQQKKGNSLPTSPSSDSMDDMKIESKIFKDSATNTASTDLSVKGLVTKYQSSGYRPTARPKSFYESRSTSKPSPDIEEASNYNQMLISNDCKRLPPINRRNSLTNHLSMTDSILKQNYSCSYRKMQHGKTHPLARLNTISKQRSAYNTM